MLPMFVHVVFFRISTALVPTSSTNRSFGPFFFLLSGFTPCPRDLRISRLRNFGAMPERDRSAPTWLWLMPELGSVEFAPCDPPLEQAQSRAIAAVAAAALNTAKPFRTRLSPPIFFCSVKGNYRRRAGRSHSAAARAGVCKFVLLCCSKN